MIEKLSVPISIVIAGGLIAGALYYSNMKSPNQVAQVIATNPWGTNTVGNMRPVSSDDHILGNPNADVVIVEYSDTECPFCKQFHTTMQRVMNEYGETGKVAWVYRHFPIDSLHAKARKEAEALECANELGGTAKFWEYTNMLYSVTNSNDSLDPAELPVIAKNVGLDVTKFNTCLASGKHAVKVQADYDDAIAAGGQGTPHSILITKDGMKTSVQGSRPYESLKATIDALLSN
jgi:protein-disulfide isomerase